MSQIFISYRREGGEIMAQLLYDKLIARGYTVFYDVESLKSGRFDSKLLEEIEKAEDFLLVLPPNGLDRCLDEEDWVRQEIRCAIEAKKNIIPVMLRGFTFPSELPEDISEVARYNGVNFGTMEFFDAKIRKIVERLKSVSPLGDQATERETAAVSGYESFRQRLMAECEELLETAKHHWSKIVADSASFSPIVSPIDRNHIRLILEDVEKWKEKKTEFEQKANSSIDIYGTAYIQDVFHSLAEELAQLTPYEESLLRYAALFAIEEELYSLKVACREDYETLVSISERIAALPEEVAAEMRPHARELFDALWRDYENQLVFEKGATLLEQMQLNLSFDMTAEEHVFTLDALPTVRSDVAMAENILQRFDALYAQCAPAEGSECTPLFVEKYQKYIDLIPAMKRFVACAKVFDEAGTLCEDITAFDEKEQLTASALAELLATRAQLSAEASAYVDPALSERLDALKAASEQAAAIAEAASRLHAERYGEDSPLQDVPYAYDTFDAAYARAYAVEAWAESVVSLEQERAALTEQRFFTREDCEKMVAIYADATALLADESRTTAANMQAAHEFEDKLVEKNESGVFAPDAITALYEAHAALPASVGTLVSAAQAERLTEEKETLDAYAETLSVRDAFRAACAPLVFANHATVKKAVAEAARMHTLLAALEERVATLATRFDEIDLPMEALRAEMQDADAFVASTEAFFATYPLYEWQVAHPDAEVMAQSDADALKSALLSYREKKAALAAYDPEGTTRAYYEGAKAALARVRRKKVSRVLLHTVAPILLPLLLLGLVALDLLLSRGIEKNGLEPVFLLAFAVCAVFSLITLRRIRAFKTPLFLLPTLAYTVYGLCFLFPKYLHSMHLPTLTALCPVVGAALAVIFFAAYVGKGTGFATFFGVITLLALIFIPLVAFFCPLREAYAASLLPSLADFLGEISPTEFVELLSEGVRWLFRTLVLGGVWMEGYADTALFDLSLAFLFSLAVRITCRRIVRHREKKTKSNKHVQNR